MGCKGRWCGRRAGGARGEAQGQLDHPRESWSMRGLCWHRPGQAEVARPSCPGTRSLLPPGRSTRAGWDRGQLCGLDKSSNCCGSVSLPVTWGRGWPPPGSRGSNQAVFQDPMVRLRHKCNVLVLNTGLLPHCDPLVGFPPTQQFQHQTCGVFPTSS